MILSPFDLALLAPVAALLQCRPQEPAVALPNDFARRLAGAGYYGPFRVRLGDHVIEDRGGHPFNLIMPNSDVSGDRREAAIIACIAINLLCGFAPPEVVPVTIELTAIASRPLAALPHADAAE